MSERKVLNKYYPPDFDPSKIPKSKEPRNKTFAIRLMAPCNMRCTTCGEYIYKGRKFNARKEDVDDMNYLGLRIYRFYIKCTACVSEICFRTDPENTDYVLESGATRNFEALKRAEEQAEREDKAHQEELENNPMKLLEERTVQSKNELELAESLDELRELNRRTVAVDYESMLKKYEEERAAAITAEERADEDFVKAIFSKDGEVKVKRLLEESSSGSSSSGGEESGTGTDREEKKKLKTGNEKVTDILTGAVKKPEKKAVWEKSIGSLDLKKKGLGILVKKKTTTTTTAPAAQPSPGQMGPPKLPTGGNIPPKPTVAGISPKKQPNSGISPNKTTVGGNLPPKPLANGGGAVAASPSAGGLGLLGAYSDSDSGGSD